MNTQATSAQALSGTFKHGAGRIILLALGCTVVAGAVVAAVAVQQSPGSETSSVATTSAALLEAAQAQHDALIDGTQGQLPSASLVDSRPSRQAERIVRTTYIVGTPEHADAVRTGIVDANAIRLAVGEPLLLDSVLVVGSDAEAEAARAVITDANRILLGLGEPEENVVDLRHN